LITIKKAIASDHGTDTGWQAVYGTTQAVFNSVIRFTTGYYVFDGQVRNESDWFNGAAYGFQIYHNNSDQNIIINTGNSGYITIRNVFVNAKYHSLPSGTGRQYAIDTEAGGSDKVGLAFQKMFVYGSNNVWFIRNTNGTLIEYCASDGAAGDGNNHGEVVNLYFNVYNSITRYCKIRNAYNVLGPGTAIWAATRCGSTGICGGTNSGHEIYGNEVSHFCSTDGAIGYIGSDTTNTKVYNNTFIDGTGGGSCWGSGVSLGSGSVAYNNIWVGWQSGRLSFSVTHDYNAFSGTSGFSEAHAQINVPNSLFVNYSGNDFRLSTDTSTGLALSAPYDSDLLGSIRGSGGQWDRGAYQYGAGAPPPPPLVRPSPPSNFKAL
jgi:hypothetical protein